LNNRRAALLALGLLAIAAFAWVVIWPRMQASRAEQLKREREAAASMASALRSNAGEAEDMYRKGRPPMSIPPRVAAETPSPVPAGGDGLMQRMQPVVLKHQANTMNDLRQFEARKNALGLETVLTPGSLATAERRRRGNESLERYLELYKEYHDLLVKRSEQYRQDTFDALKGHPDRLGIMNGFDKSMHAVLEDYEDMLDIQLGAVSRARGLIDFVGTREFAYRDGRLVFAKEEDAGYYKSMVADVQEYSRREDALRARLLARSRSAADGIERLAR